MCFISFAALIFSIDSSNSTAKIQNDVKESLLSMTTPVVKLGGVAYVLHGNGNADKCQNPPIGLIIYLKNVSGIAAIQYTKKFEFWFGEKPFAIPPRSVNFSESVLAPGEMNVAQIVDPEIPQYLQSSDRTTMINFHIKATYGSPYLWDSV